jgi:bifunctional DNA-binding transcriptional regulator/antitoxin component of YhaV-PrlF toxin-antitoxin module
MTAVKPRRTRRKGLTRISRYNQVTLPVDVVLRAGLKPGDSMAVELKTTGEIVLRPEVDPLDKYIGMFDGLYPPGYLRALRDEWER